MSLLVGKKAPEFSLTAVVNGGEIVKDYSLAQFEGQKYVLLFFYPKDFSAVCPIEMHEFQANLAEFEKRNVQVIACSTDSDASHKAWLNLDKSEGGIKGITYPILADLNKTVSHNYHVLNGEWAYDEDGQLHAGKLLYGNAPRRRHPSRNRRMAVLRRARRGMPAQLRAQLNSFSLLVSGYRTKPRKARNQKRVTSC